MGVKVSERCELLKPTPKGVCSSLTPRPGVSVSTITKGVELAVAAVEGAVNDVVLRDGFGLKPPILADTGHGMKDMDEEKVLEEDQRMIRGGWGARY